MVARFEFKSPSAAWHRPAPSLPCATSILLANQEFRFDGDAAVAASGPAPQAAPLCALGALPPPTPVRPRARLRQASGDGDGASAFGGAGPVPRGNPGVAAAAVRQSGADAQAALLDAASADDGGAPPAAAPPQNWRAEPPWPATSAAGADGFAAIDDISVDEILESPFAHVRDLESRHHELWAHVNVDVFSAIEDAWNRSPDVEGNADLDRALKMQLLCHDLLLRVPPRGGRRRRAR